MFCIDERAYWGEACTIRPTVKCSQVLEGALSLPLRLEIRHGRSAHADPVENVQLTAGSASRKHNACTDNTSEIAADVEVYGLSELRSRLSLVASGRAAVAMGDR